MCVLFQMCIYLITTFIKMRLDLDLSLLLIKMWISNLVRSTRLWNNTQQVAKKPKQTNTTTEKRIESIKAHCMTETLH